jgi:hypothetical protein
MLAARVNIIINWTKEKKQKNTFKIKIPKNLLIALPAKENLSQILLNSVIRTH